MQNTDEDKNLQQKWTTAANRVKDNTGVAGFRAWVDSATKAIEHHNAHDVFGDGSRIEYPLKGNVEDLVMFKLHGMEDKVLEMKEGYGVEAPPGLENPGKGIIKEAKLKGFIPSAETVGIDLTDRDDYSFHSDVSSDYDPSEEKKGILGSIKSMFFSEKEHSGSQPPNSSVYVDMSGVVLDDEQSVASDVAHISQSSDVDSVDSQSSLGFDVASDVAHISQSSDVDSVDSQSSLGFDAVPSDDYRKTYGRTDKTNGFAAQLDLDRAEKGLNIQQTHRS